MVSLPDIGIMKTSEQTEWKEERLGEKRVELQIFINPTVGSLSRPCVPMQIKSTTHIHKLHIFKLCHPTHINPSWAESAVLRRML